MWPNGIIAPTKTAIATALASIDDNHLVDVTIAVPVIKTPRDISFQQGIDDVLHKELRVLVVRYRAAILHKTVNDDVLQVEDGAERVVALRNKIVANGAEIGCLAEILRIENHVPIFHGLHLVAHE